MGQDVFLKLGKIDGDASDKKHSDYIEITSFSLSVSNKEDALLKTDERKEGATIEAISFSKKFDKSTSKILDLACKNDPLDGECTVHFCRPGGQLVASSGLSDYLVFTLTDASVESYSFSGGGGFPTENFTLQFSKLEWEQKDENGTRTGGGAYVRPDSKTTG